MTHTPTLKSCPFCGCTNVNLISPSLGRSSWTVVCDDCCAEGPTVPTYNSGEAEYVAALAWNGRTALSQLAEASNA